MAAWIVAVLALCYVGGLFLIANWAERHASDQLLKKYGGLIYSLALAVYCTSWTYYGAVGSAISSGWDYVPIYLGPLLVFVFGQPVLRKLLFVAKKHNVTSITDFISARYGKRHAIAAMSALLCLIVVVPYIALQLKAVATSYQVLLGQPENTQAAWWQDSALLSALTMTLFAILFGTRKVLLTEQNRGVMVAIAFESVIKLTALLTLAFAVCWFVLDRPWSVFSDFTQYAATRSNHESFSLLAFITKTVLAMAAIFLLPRQFHVTFVENVAPQHLQHAKRWFSGYLVLVTLVVLPIALAGYQLFPQQLAHADSFVLLLPASQGWESVSALVFIGGFSAATSMIIIATLALSTMISNDVVMPTLLRANPNAQLARDYSPLILRVRRLMIVVVMALSYGYYTLFARNYELAETGLLAFALIIQLAPAVLGGLYWRRGQASGVYAGVGIGFTLWFFCLMLPQLVSVGVVDSAIMQQGLFGQSWLRPTRLFGLDIDPLSHGVLWSLGLNLLAYVAMSLLHKANLNDRLQAVAFVKPNLPLDEVKTARRSRIYGQDLKTLLERFIGVDRADESIAEFSRRQRQAPALDEAPEPALVRHIERELAGVIGSSSAAAMVNAVLDGRQLAFEDVVTLFDDTRQAIQFSRKILFSTLEHLSQGVSVVDRDLQLVAWNRQYLEMFDYPEGMVRVGRSIADIVRFNAERGLCGEGSADDHVQKRLQHMQRGTAHVFQRVRPDGTVIEMRGNPIPGGGFVTSFTDITGHVKAVQQLAEAKQHLEQRVVERTQQISQINDELLDEIDLRRITEQQLLLAKAEAESANASKTRFLALASHDILQPLNAARLFTAALQEQAEPARQQAMIGQLDNSLKATEELISTLLEIAKLDDGKLEPARQPVELAGLLRQLHDEYSLLAMQKNLQLKVRTSSYLVQSNSTYLRRILQNMLSNAIKYTPTGKVLLGCRRRGELLCIEVWDTGPGIAAQDLPYIFDDFYRVDATARGESGVGLGLGVVQRMAKSLGHRLEVVSVPGKGTVFRFTVPFLNKVDVADIQNQSLPVVSVAHSPFAGLSICCVDDDTANLTALAALLRQWGVGNLRSCHDAASILQLATTTAAPDVLILDYQLGQHQHGLQLYQQLQQYWPGVPAILVSAAPEPDLPERAKQAGMIFLAKPIKAAALRASLNYLRLAKGS
ncbi:response regulator [Rheinheimera riviphila]|uniref:histidine kinase n=1 Tax=Rheinheimera riviphila TaxID=1834037 RepID=A0A437R1W1_9GAMM|nr:PAS-domain containing protein [Rheinheimera riviphila]RVU40740.1 response regulator [Rheinheimera riviphila]